MFKNRGQAHYATIHSLRLRIYSTYALRTFPLMIRLAVAADLPAVMTLEAEAFATDRLSRRSLLYMLKNPQASFWVTEPEASLQGYAILLEHRRSKSARLYSIALSSQFQGKGLADTLMAHLERQCKKRAIKLEVRQDNLRAQKFYARRGYENIGIRESFYADGMSALILRKAL